MGSFGGFYKGDKKKKKKGNDKSNVQVMSSKPVFVMPKMVEKKKKDW